MPGKIALFACRTRFRGADWQETMGKKPPCEAVAALAESVEASAAGDEDPQAPRLGIEKSLQIVFPVRRLVDFVQNQEVGEWGPGLGKDDVLIARLIPVEIEGAAIGLHGCLGKPALYGCS
ncbi:MAG: hypothetical protein WCQ50_14160 [Spirochaetota bacterium]